MNLDIDTVRRHLAVAPVNARVLPENASVVIRDDAGLGNAAVFHYDWRLQSGAPSRGITVKLPAVVMERFAAADRRERERIEETILRIIRVRLAQGGYQEVDPPEPPLVVTFYDHDFD